MLLPFLLSEDLRTIVKPQQGEQLWCMLITGVFANKLAIVAKALVFLFIFTGYGSGWIAFNV